MPRLILQPLLENAFEHGLEDKVQDGKLWVHFAESGGEYQVLVEDNGEVPDEKLEEMKEGLGKVKAQSSGIYNINRRLRLFYHNRAGLKVGRSVLGGVCMAIFIPAGNEENSHVYMDI